MRRKLKGELVSLKPEIVRAAQRIYDYWDGTGGGICDFIAREIAGIIRETLSDVEVLGCEALEKYYQDPRVQLFYRKHELMPCMFGSKRKTHLNDYHNWVIAAAPDRTEAYIVDIDPYIYETKYRYSEDERGWVKSESWFKVPKVIFEVDDVQLTPIDQPDVLDYSEGFVPGIYGMPRKHAGGGS